MELLLFEVFGDLLEGVFDLFGPGEEGHLREVEQTQQVELLTLLEERPILKVTLQYAPDPLQPRIADILQLRHPTQPPRKIFPLFAFQFQVLIYELFKGDLDLLQLEDRLALEGTNVLVAPLDVVVDVVDEGLAEVTQEDGKGELG